MEEASGGKLLMVVVLFGRRSIGFTLKGATGAVTRDGRQLRNTVLAHSRRRRKMALIITCIRVRYVESLRSSSPTMIPSHTQMFRGAN